MHIDKELILLIEEKKWAILLILSTITAVIIKGGKELLNGLFFSLITLIVLYYNYKKQRNSLSTILMVGFILRFFTASSTELFLFFPEKYYSDAFRFQKMSTEIALAWSSFKFSNVVGSFGHLSYSRFIAIFYIIFGSSNFLCKIINSIIGTAAFIPVWKISEKFVGDKRAEIVTCLFAVWPSIIYFSSQNARESIILFNFVWSSYFMLDFLKSPKARTFFYGFIFSIVTGLFRPEMMFILFFGWMIIAIFLIFKKSIFSLLLVLPAILLLILSWFLSPNIPFFKTTTVKQEAHLQQDRSTQLLQSLSAYRKNVNKTQEIYPETALFEDVEFRCWFDVVKFIPRGIFYFLFMPLPGLCPIYGNISRILAALENLALLIITVFSLKNLIISKKNVVTWFNILFLLIIFSIHALTEPDLGSSIRHKVIYLPLIFSLYQPQSLFIFRRIAHKIGT